MQQVASSPISSPIKYLGDRAIVIGGSIAGMLSARVLADYFAQVTIVDRDILPATPQARRGVPQSVQPHVLFTKGYRILGELFPGIEQQLANNGALTIDWAREFKHYFAGHWGLATDEPSEIVSVTCSRYLLEWTIRQELSKLANVSFVSDSKVAGLTGNSAQVTGVSVNRDRELEADLVIDASGRSSQAVQWLKQLGCAAPSETVINPFLGYATRRYRLADDQIADWKVMLISQTPPDDKRLGYLAKIEGNEIIATLGGYGKDFPPLEESGFLEFARSLAQPDFYQAIANAVPTSPIYAHRATANRLRHYEKIELPAGFFILGDATCALCPVYGQGMTVSALAVKILQTWLYKSSQSSKSASDQLNNNRFQKQLAKSNSFHWMLATSQDSRFLTTQGRKDSSGIVDKLMNGYANKLLSKSTSQPNLHLTFLEVAHLLRSPLALYNPQVIWQVLK